MEQLRWWLELRERERVRKWSRWCWWTYRIFKMKSWNYLSNSRWIAKYQINFHNETPNETSNHRELTPIPFSSKISPRSANSLRRAFSIIKLMISFDLYRNKDIFVQPKGWDRASHINHDLSIICDFQWFSTIPYTQLNSKTMKIPFNDIFH